MERQPSATEVLIVRGRSPTDELGTALTDQGFRVKRCEGPGRVPCPILRAKRCPLRESVDLAVVYVDGKKTWPASGLLPRLLCAHDAESPVVVLLEGRRDPPSHGRNAIVIGSEQPTSLIANTARGLIEEESSHPTRTTSEGGL